jgi:hypothetical protein
LNNPLRFLHTLVLTGSGKRRYWLAPAEMGSGELQISSFALPVDEDRKPFPSYQVEILRYGSDGRREVRETATLERDRRLGDFSLQLDGHMIQFGPLSNSPVLSCFPYKGKLVHPDFGYLLAALEPHDPEQLDKLFLDDRLLILGCDPFAHYGGLNGPSPDGGFDNQCETGSPLTDPVLRPVE